MAGARVYARISEFVQDWITLWITCGGCLPADRKLTIKWRLYAHEIILTGYLPALMRVWGEKALKIAIAAFF